MISLIAAVDRNRLIGASNRLPWHLVEDLKYFKRVTQGHPVVMGRKTYESIGRLLPGRENRIVSRQKGYIVPGARVFGSVRDACQAAGPDVGGQEIFVIGGAQIYAEAMPLAHRLYLTQIDFEFAGDTYFPQWPASAFREISREEHPPDPGSGRPYGFAFVILERA